MSSIYKLEDIFFIYRRKNMWTNYIPQYKAILLGLIMGLVIASLLYAIPYFFL